MHRKRVRSLKLGMAHAKHVTTGFMAGLKRMPHPFNGCGIFFVWAQIFWQNRNLCGIQLMDAAFLPVTHEFN
jgi:hypothetical protein